ncbi:MAG: M20/M25/M40 family metallo-hydrolase [Candidatus Pacebacteria bacterium]|nr:M20/M25/M40 family metallo-hydrolase [Candidatus Paceibacterota bacterium]
MSLNNLLSQLVSKDTRYAKKSEGNLEDLLTKTLNDLGFSTSIIKTDDRPNILADNGKEGKSILFYGHIDTVDVVPGWSREPFELTIEGNKAYGLGAYDMKGGIAAFLSAIGNSKKHIKVLLAVDEENISSGAWDVVKKKKEFFSDVELIISAEPNFGLGLNGITVGRTGRVLFTVGAQGKPVHIAKHETGINAIYPLTEFISKLKDSSISKDKMTVIQPRNVVTNTIGMSLCEYAEVDIEVLLGSDDSIEEIKKELIKLTKKVNDNFKVKLKKRETPYLTGYRFTSFPYQKEISKIIQKYTGEKIQLHERSSVGDDNVLASLGIPVITWGPNGAGAHEVDEWVDLDSLEKLKEMYSELLENL